MFIMFEANVLARRGRGEAKGVILSFLLWKHSSCLVLHVPGTCGFHTKQPRSRHTLCEALDLAKTVRQKRVPCI